LCILQGICSCTVFVNIQLHTVGAAFRETNIFLKVFTQAVNETVKQYFWLIRLKTYAKKYLGSGSTLEIQLFLPRQIIAEVFR
jgi:hypothetical protein